MLFLSGMITSCICLLAGVHCVHKSVHILLSRCRQVCAHVQACKSGSHTPLLLVYLVLSKPSLGKGGGAASWCLQPSHTLAEARTAPLTVLF